MSDRSSVVSPFSRLPPIISSEADRYFLQSINNYAEEEMRHINQDDTEQRYIIYKTVFNKVIEHVSAYQPILSQIKQEYEDTIDAIKKGQREAAFLSGKLKAMASEPTTLRNYTKRGDELEDKVSVIRKDNARLKKELKELQDSRKAKEQKIKEVQEPPKRELKKDNRRIPGLSLEETTDLKVLNKKLEKLDRQLKELNISFKTRYLPKTRKLELKENLDNKVIYRDNLLNQALFYKAKRAKLEIALVAAQAYNKVKPPHQTVGDAVAHAFTQYLESKKAAAEKEKTASENKEGDGSTDETSTTKFEDDDPNKEKEAEMMLEYIEKFNELFEDGLYAEAAVHAANSPKGILRTSATLHKFREVKLIINGRTPLLSFCDALMSSVVCLAQRPNEVLSRECVECILNESRLDLLAHWIGQAKLTLSPQLGNLVRDHCKCKIPCKCGCQALAQSVYSKLGENYEAVLCMLRQGRIQAGMQYAKNKSGITKDNYISMVELCPSLLLIKFLLEPEKSGQRPLPFGKVIQTLVQNGNVELAIHAIQDLQQKKVTGSTENYTPFHAALFDDKETSIDTWCSISTCIHDHGHADLSDILIAAVTVTSAINGALQVSV